MKNQTVLRLTLGALFYVAVVLSILGSLSSCQQETFNPGQTEKLSIESATLAATYPITVGLPDNYHSSQESYGTIYVLDGEENFDLVSKTCQEISASRSTPNVLDISIGYGRDRAIDYTPTKVDKGSGGGPEFLTFLKNELIPEIEKRYRVDTTRASRVILGHSYGGLFGACAFAADNNLFGNYILLSPSIWYDNEVTLALEKQYRSVNKTRHQLVFMGIGEMENAGRMQAPFEAFHETLGDNYPDMDLAKNREKFLDHVGSKDPNIVKGLKYYFQNR